MEGDLQLRAVNACIQFLLHRRQGLVHRGGPGRPAWPRAHWPAAYPVQQAPDGTPTRSSAASCTPGFRHVPVRPSTRTTLNTRCAGSDAPSATPVATGYRPIVDAGARFRATLVAVIARRARRPGPLAELVLDYRCRVAFLRGPAQPGHHNNTRIAFATARLAAPWRARWPVPPTYPWVTFSAG